MADFFHGSGPIRPLRSVPSANAAYLRTGLVQSSLLGGKGGRSRGFKLSVINNWVPRVFHRFSPKSLNHFVCTSIIYIVCIAFNHPIEPFWRLIRCVSPIRDEQIRAALLTPHFLYWRKGIAIRNMVFGCWCRKRRDGRVRILMR